MGTRKTRGGDGKDGADDDGRREPTATRPNPLRFCQTLWDSERLSALFAAFPPPSSGRRGPLVPRARAPPLRSRRQNCPRARFKVCVCVCARARHPAAVAGEAVIAQGVLEIRIFRLGYSDLDLPTRIFRLRSSDSDLPTRIRRASCLCCATFPQSQGRP